ncbi:MAG: class I SAM-dependent methyltransferase [Myxococcales bacterium]|nr:MAG: class I SAM-dependent methyltransferase [Myxococcales bacterium]
MSKPTRDYYDAFSDVYERRRHDGYHHLIDELETAIVRPYAEGKQALEAGCGTGLILERVARFAASAKGVDLSPGMLRKARARGLDVAEADLCALPFADGTFDVVYSFKVLAHVPPIREALAELARVVRPGGHLVLEFYNPTSLRGLVKRFKPPTRIVADTDDEQVFTRYDRLADILGYLPPDVEYLDCRGVRILTPAAAVHRWPLVGPLLGQAERALAVSPLRRLAGFLVVILRKR